MQKSHGISILNPVMFSNSSKRSEPLGMTDTHKSAGAKMAPSQPIRQYPDIMSLIQAEQNNHFVDAAGPSTAIAIKNRPVAKKGTVDTDEDQANLGACVHLKRQDTSQHIPEKSRPTSTVETLSQSHELNDSDVFLNLALGSDVSSSLSKLEPSYARELKEEISKEGGTSLRDYQKRLKTKHHQWFGTSLSHALDPVGHERDRLAASVQSSVKARRALQKKLHKRLGSYSYFLLKASRDQLLSLSSQETYITTSTQYKLKAIYRQLEDLFDLIDIYADNKESLSKTLSLWQTAVDTHDRQDLEALLDTLKDELSVDFSKDESIVETTYQQFDKQLRFERDYQSTRGSFTDLRRALKKLAENSDRVLENAAFSKDDMVRDIHQIVSQMRKALHRVKVDGHRSVKDHVSTVYQRTNDGQASLRQAMPTDPEGKEKEAMDKVASSTLTVSTIKPPKATDARDASQAGSIKTSSRRIKQRKTSKSNKARTIASSAPRHGKRSKSLSRRIEHWRANIHLSRPIDGLYTRLRGDVEAFLKDVRDLDESSKYQDNPKEYQALQKRLTVLKKELKALSGTKQSAKLWQLLKPVLSRLGITWDIYRRFISGHINISSPTLDYLTKMIAQNRLDSAESPTHAKRHRRKRHSHPKEAVKQPAALPSIDYPRENAQDKVSQVAQKSIAPSSPKDTSNAKAVSHPVGSQKVNQNLHESLQLSGLIAGQEPVNQYKKSHTVSERGSLLTEMHGDAAGWEDVATTASRAQQSSASISTVKARTTGKQRAVFSDGTKTDRPVMHKQVLSDESTNSSFSKRYSSNSDEPSAALSGRVVLTREKKLWWFKIGKKQIDMSEALYERLYHQGDVLVSPSKI